MPLQPPPCDPHLLLPSSMVTIGPLVLLSLLGVTFRLGSKPARPPNNALLELSERGKQRAQAKARGGPANATRRSDMWAPLGENKPDAQVGSLAGRGQATSDKGATSTGTHRSTGSSNMNPGAQNRWTQHPDGVARGDDAGAAEAGRTPSSSEPPGHVKNAIVSSRRSLRNICKAGPGDKTDSEQVHLAVGIGWRENAGDRQLLCFHTKMLYVCRIPPP